MLADALAKLFDANDRVVALDKEDLPLRSQRHMPNSIATLRIRLARTLA
jgi:hypothetical protein